MEPIKAERIEHQTYRVGRYVAYFSDRRNWVMGQPVEPEYWAAGFVAGTVTIHSSLREAVSFARWQVRRQRQGETQ